MSPESRIFRVKRGQLLRSTFLTFSGSIGMKHWAKMNKSLYRFGSKVIKYGICHDVNTDIWNNYDLIVEVNSCFNVCIKRFISSTFSI